MARFAAEETEEWVASLASSKYYPLVDVKVTTEGEEGEVTESWAPARVEQWRKPAGSDESEAMVAFVGFEAGGLQAARQDEVRGLVVPPLERGTALIEGVEDLKIGAKVRAVYLVDRCWYEGTVVSAFGKRHFATVLFDEYEETQNTAWPLIAKVVDADLADETASLGTTTADDDDDPRGVAAPRRSRAASPTPCDEARVQHYVGLARAGVPLVTVEAAARNDGVPEGLIRRRIEEARRSNAPPTKPPGHNPRAVVAELEASQCFEDAFLKRVFEHYDVRAPKNQLTPMDFVDALKRASPELAKSALELFVAFDGDENGGLDFNEFKAGVRRLVLERDDDGVKALVWYWRSQQEEWFVGTGTAGVDSALGFERHAPRVARGNIGRVKKKPLSLIGTMALGGKPREISRPCVVKLDYRTQNLTVWKLASTAEAHRTTELPPLSTARFHGKVLDASVVDSRAKRAAYRCDAIATLSSGGANTEDVVEVKMWLPKTASERARWITALYEAAAAARSANGAEGEFLEDPTQRRSLGGAATERGSLRDSSSGGEETKEEEEEEELSPEAIAEKFLDVKDADASKPPNEVRVVVWRGLNLVARDHSILGGAGTSDPYVRVYAEGNSGMWRATRVVHKNLNPSWVQTFSFPYDAEKSKSRRCRVIFVCSDHDRASRDDFMGSLSVEGTRGKLADAAWIDLTSVVPNDPLTKDLADTSKKNAATATGALQVSVLLRRAVTLFDDPSIFEPDQPACLLVGAHSARIPEQKSSSFSGGGVVKRHPRLLAKLLGTPARAATSVRVKTNDPQWAEVLALDPPDDFLASSSPASEASSSKTKKHRILELVLEDVDPYSGKAKPLGVAHVQLDQAQGFTLRKTYDLRPPLGNTRGAAAAAKTVVGQVDVVVYFRPDAFRDASTL